VRDRQQLEELTGAVSLGVLAEDAVLATSHVLHGSSDSADLDKKTLIIAQKILEDLSSATTIQIIAPSGHRQMNTDEVYLDAFRAVRLQAPDQPVQEYLRNLADALKRVIDSGTVEDEDRSNLEEVQSFFACVGEVTLARANELFERSRKEPLPWIRTDTTSLS
jgi:hypothetical protein